METILVVDDEKNYLLVLSAVLFLITLILPLPAFDWLDRRRMRDQALAACRDRQQLVHFSAAGWRLLREELPGHGKRDFHHARLAG